MQIILKMYYFSIIVISIISIISIIVINIDIELKITRNVRANNKREIKNLLSIPVFDFIMKWKKDIA